jgi:hypothetical protein
MRVSALILCLPFLALVGASNGNAQFFEKNMTATVEVAFGDIVAAYDEILSSRAYEEVDIVNTTNCDVQVRFDTATNTPDTVVPAGTSETLNFGRNNGYITSTVSLQYMTGETCSSGSVYIKGLY